MLNTEKVVGILKHAGLVAKRSDRQHTRPGFTTRKIDAYTVGVLFDSMAVGTAKLASVRAAGALRAAGFSVATQEDGQTLVVRGV